ncbi:MAG: type 12 methyltransferase [Chloroflexi bacterium]|nr:type 12 methyltransferase [Chloroflexota bacterium]
MLETNTNRQVDEAKLGEFVGKLVSDAATTLSSALVLIGDKLGLYKAMADNGPLDSAGLARLTNTSERYIREWLVNQASTGYIEYNPATGMYSLPPEQALALTGENSPYYVIGLIQVVTAIMKADTRITEAFRTGAGMGWGEHDHNLFEGTERLFRPGYIANLVQNWLPALDGVNDKLTKGAMVADVGCGYGASTIIMAKAYPNSRFTGFDFHGPSIERARKAAEDAGLNGRVNFEVADSTSYPGQDYDLIAFFDCFHDLPDPVATARHTYQALSPRGTALVVEPMAGETVEANFNPVGSLFSAASTMCCTPNGLTGKGPALGAIVTEKQLSEIFKTAGFSSFRRATETPFNRVFEARP